jgi:small neutral amino acid transporter SnatA (MarC family)
MKLFILNYILPALFILGGLALFIFGIRERSPQEKIHKKDLPTYGKGGRIHHVYVGSILIVSGLYLIFR